MNFMLYIVVGFWRMRCAMSNVVILHYFHSFYEALGCVVCNRNKVFFTHITFQTKRFWRFSTTFTVVEINIDTVSSLCAGLRKIREGGGVSALADTIDPNNIYVSRRGRIGVRATTMGDTKRIHGSLNHVTDRVSHV